jgi:hypothetical protein
MFDLKMIKLLDYSTLYAKWSEEIITLSDKKVGIAKSGEKMNIIIRKQEQ